MCKTLTADGFDSVFKSAFGKGKVDNKSKKKIMTKGNQEAFEEDAHELAQGLQLYEEHSHSGEEVTSPVAPDEEKDWWQPYENKISLKKFSA